MKWRWVGLREACTQSREMKQSDEEREVSRRWSGRMEPGQAGSSSSVGEDESTGLRCWGSPVNHSMMDHDVSG